MASKTAFRRAKVTVKACPCSKGTAQLPLTSVPGFWYGPGRFSIFGMSAAAIASESYRRKHHMPISTLEAQHLTLSWIEWRWANT